MYPYLKGFLQYNTTATHSQKIRLHCVPSQTINACIGRHSDPVIVYALFPSKAWTPGQMSGTYHYIPQKFRKMPPPSIIRDRQGHPDLSLLQQPVASHTSPSSEPFNPSTSETYDLLLLHQVPSPSLCLEEMLDLCAHGPKPPSINCGPRKVVSFCPPGYGDRSSVATLVEFGEWVSKQAQNRPPSLLPPPPDVLLRNPLISNTDSVECRLPSSTKYPSGYERKSDSKQSVSSIQLQSLSSRLDELSVQSGIPSTPPARSITPVPSLTNSQYSSCTSSAAAAESPFSTKNSPISDIENASCGPSSSRATQRTARHNGTFSFDWKSASLGLKEDSMLVFPSPPSVPVDRERHTPHRPVPDLEYNTTRIQDHILLQIGDQPEVSYIDWDDDENSNRRGESRLARMKKSLNDLRVAERFISEANVRRIAHLAKETQHSVGNPEPAVFNDPQCAREYQSQDLTLGRKLTVSDIHHPTIRECRRSAWLEQERLRTQAAAKLRKRSTNNPSHTDGRSTLVAQNNKEAKPSNYMVSDSEGATTHATTSGSTIKPPSKGKRKRSGTTASQGRCKTARLGVVGRWVKRVLGCENDHSAE